MRQNIVALKCLKNPIDFGVANDIGLIKRQVVRRNCDVSDHLPVAVTINIGRDIDFSRNHWITRLNRKLLNKQRIRKNLKEKVDITSMTGGFFEEVVDTFSNQIMNSLKKEKVISKVPEDKIDRINLSKKILKRSIKKKKS